MVDSGAFSAWNKGEPELSLREYTAYIKRNERHLFAYVNMDKIPGKFGVKRTQRDVELSAKQSYDNLQEMKSHGLSPIPVFHQDEEFKWLERMLRDGESYIGLSSGKEMGDARRIWLNRIFSMICDSRGVPLIRVHGFGITKGSYLFTFPWASTDSTSWTMTAGYGKIYVPPPNLDGTYNYNVPPIGIAVSGLPNKANNATQFEAETFFKDTGIREAYIRRFIEEECRVSLSDLRYSLSGRQRAILTYYVNVMNNWKSIRFRKQPRGFFVPHTDDVVAGRAKPMKLHVMFATLIRQHTWAKTMQDVGASTRLLSYYDTRTCDDSRLAEYASTGNITVRIQAPAKHHPTSVEYRNMQALGVHRRMQENGENDG